MKIIFLTKYSRKGASSRLRSYQYFPFFEKEGISVTVKPLFDDEYLNKLYAGDKLYLQIASYYLKRFIILFTLKKYDKVVIEKELFPYFPSVFEKLMKLFEIGYIVDYDDAIFHNYDLSNNKLISYFFKNKIDHVMKNSSCVIAGNSYLAQRAKKAGAKKIETLPTVIDLKRYKIINKTQGKSVVIGWIGSPSTFKYVKSIKKTLEKLAKKYSIKIYIIGAAEDLNIGEYVKYIKWEEETEVSGIQKFDVGIMPLESTPWELGKCSYKLIQYMGCGIPVIASPVGMNIEVVRHNENGFLANSNDDWYNYLEKLILDVELRKSLGANGRALVEEKYSIQKSFNSYKNLVC